MTDSIRIDHWVKLGTTIKEARIARGWSQHGLAQRANVSRSWLARVEAGHRGTELEPLLRALAALDITLRLDQNPINPSPINPQPPSTPSREEAWGLR
jgi:transcriptional regulator with XRE-family HTH domain